MSIKENVKDYYGKILTHSADLKTNACCSIDTPAPYQQDILNMIEPEIRNTFYGCGSPIPPLVHGLKIMDLGCGTGRDVYVLSKLVGENGHVIGIDMTPEQLAIATKYQDSQAKQFGFSRSNVTFITGYIEDLGAATIDSNSIDCIVSNCVLNLSPDKPSVFKEMFRVLKPGGELYISDVFSDRRIPEQLSKDPVLYGECLTGALYKEDFRRLLSECGCSDYQIMSEKRLTINNEETEKKVGDIQFYSTTFRAFKLTLEDCPEDYGQWMRYKGGIPEYPDSFILDQHTEFKKDTWQAVSGNTADILTKTRFAPHFELKEDQKRHVGLFKARKPPVSTRSCC